MWNSPARISAAALGIWQSCARRYALSYRAKRYWPAAEGPNSSMAFSLDEAREEALGIEGADFEMAEEESLPIAAALALSKQAQRRLKLGASIGSTLHARIWAHAQGIAPEAIHWDGAPWSSKENEEAEGQLAEKWMAYLLSAESQVQEGQSWQEIKLEGSFDGLRLDLRFDRLRFHNGLWWIVDFKSGKAPKGQPRKKLQQSWQARLYPFALVHLGEALGMGAIAPESIRLQFIYLGGKAGPELVEFILSARKQAATSKALRQEIPALNQAFSSDAPLQEWPFAPARSGLESPMVWNSSHPCLVCPYFSLCHPLPSPETHAPEAWGPAHFVWRLDEGSKGGDAGS